MDSLSVISQFLELQPSGDRLVGLCPFHPDKDTLSFTVYPDDRGWYCFGCGRGGGPIQFLMAKGMTYSQAKQWIDLREGKLSLPQFKLQFKKPKKVAKPSHTVVDYWHTLLRNHRKYFHSRMLTDETIDEYRLGWTGNRFSIPFWAGDRIVSVQSRRNGSMGPKYMWELGSQPHLFGIQNLAGDGDCFVFFSTLDSLLAIQDGLRAVAVPGQTVGLGKDCWEELSAKAVSLLGFRNMIIIPDRGEEVMGYRLAHRLNCEAKEWPEGPFTDYCEFRQHYGAEIFKKFMEV